MLSNWEKQIQDHVVDGKLTYYTYYGNGRGVKAAELKKYDVVITTYQTVTQEHDFSVAGKGGAPAAKKQKTDKGLFDVAWKVRRQNAPCSRDSQYNPHHRGSFLTRVTTSAIRGLRWQRLSVRSPHSGVGS